MTISIWDRDGQCLFPTYGPDGNPDGKLIFWLCEKESKAKFGITVTIAIHQNPPLAARMTAGMLLEAVNQALTHFQENLAMQNMEERKILQNVEERKKINAGKKA